MGRGPPVGYGPRPMSSSLSAASLIPGLWVLIWAGSFVSAHVAAPPKHYADLDF